MPHSAFAILTRGSILPAATRCVVNTAVPRTAQCFQQAWHALLRTYLERTPSAVQAIACLDELGGRVHNDHIALRSFVDSRGESGLDYLGAVLSAFGYAREEDIVIPSLPVNARWYEPPAETDWPKVFVSELRTAELSPEASAIIYSHVDGYYREAQSRVNRCIVSGDGDELARLLDEPPWSPSVAEVAAVRAADGGDAGLRAATEYASWTLTHGHRINHLTILQNVIGLGEDARTRDLASLNAFLAAQGLKFNAAGGSDGLTQGSPALHLEQSSTVADLVPHTFGCGTTEEVTCAFLELIQRHDGFRGFLGQNAKGIFQSTHAR